MPGNDIHGGFATHIVIPARGLCAVDPDRLKAVGIELKEQHSKQAVDYAANQGVEWVALTGLCQCSLCKKLGQKVGTWVEASEHLEQAKTVRDRCVSPGRRIVDGKFERLGESGKCCVSRQSPVRCP